MNIEENTNYTYKALKENIIINKRDDSFNDDYGLPGKHIMFSI